MPAIRRRPKERRPAMDPRIREHLLVGGVKFVRFFVPPPALFAAWEEFREEAEALYAAGEIASPPWGRRLDQHRICCSANPAPQEPRP